MGWASGNFFCIQRAIRKTVPCRGKKIAEKSIRPWILAMNRDSQDNVSTLKSRTM